MKKITLLTFLLATTFVFSQSLPLDFEVPEDDNWTGFDINFVGVVTDPTDATNNVLELQGSGLPFDGGFINLDTYVDLTDDANNTVTFEFWAPDANNRTHLLKFEAGLNGEQTELTFTSDMMGWQTVSVDFGPGLTEYERLVLFPDFNNADTGTYYVDDIDGPNGGSTGGPTCSDGIQNGDETGVDCGGPDCAACPTPPTVAAPTPPARPANEVVSIYSDAYAEIPAINYDAGFCGAGAVTEITPGGNAAFAFNNQPCQGIDFSANPQDIAGFTNIHVDLFIEAGVDIVGKVFNISVVHPAGQGETVLTIDLNALSPAPTPGTWFSFDRVETFNNPTVRQITVTSNLQNTVWYDNLYIHQDTVLNADSFDENNFNVFPNPATDAWTINSTKQINQIQLFDVLGKNVSTLNPNSLNAQIDASDLNKGIYFATISTDSGSQSVKLIKN